MNALALHILDLLNNAYFSGADAVRLTITEIPLESLCFIDLSDNGKGMSKEMLLHVFDPFFSTKTTPNTGKGIPLAKNYAENTGGYLKIRSQEKTGTHLQMLLHTHSESMLPWGDMAGILSLCFTSYPNQELSYTHYVQSKYFHTTSSLLKMRWEKTKLQHPQTIQQIKKYLTREENKLAISA